MNLINCHQKIVGHQKNKFNETKDNLQENDCLLIMDFKENMKLVLGPNETKMDFYKKRQISVLGISMIYKKNNSIITNYFTYFLNSFHMILFLLEIVSNYFLKKIILKYNFFGGCHRKNLVDGHFGKLSI